MAEDASTRTRTGQAVRHLRDLIRACQMADGAIRMSSVGDEVRIVPYFGNLAAEALLAAQQIESNPEDLRRVRLWIQWYASHQELDGTINDYGGTLERYWRQDGRDSTDSYAATYLNVLWRYWQMTHDPDMKAVFLPAAEKALDAIAMTVDPADGLTWTKPEYRVKYLMDNLEVCIGLEEGAWFFDAMGAGDLAARAKAMRDRVLEGLREYWKGDRGCFAWAKREEQDAAAPRQERTAAEDGPQNPGAPGDACATQERWDVSLATWYPDVMVNLFAVAQVRPTPVGLWRRVYDRFGEERRDWPQWWAYAAMRVGTPQELAQCRGLVVDHALRMTPDSHALDQLSMSLLALVPAVQWPVVELDYPPK